MGSPLSLPALPRWLAVTEADGQRSAGLVILAGVVLGAGLVQLFTSLGGRPDDPAASTPIGRSAAAQKAAGHGAP